MLARNLIPLLNLVSVFICASVSPLWFFAKFKHATSSSRICFGVAVLRNAFRCRKLRNCKNFTKSTTSGALILVEYHAVIIKNLRLELQFRASAWLKV